MQNFISVCNRVISNRNDDTPFDNFVTECLSFYNKPCSSIQEMRSNRNTKVKGDIFELFCKAYLYRTGKYDKVWLLKEIPDEVAKKLNLNTSRDFGIDIVCRSASKDLYSAVQCKFKKPKEGLVPGTRFLPYDCVNWKTLSTFITLTTRTNNNNWEKVIVMTNAKYVRRQGSKTPKDVSYCYGTFNSLKAMDFIELSTTVISLTECQEEGGYSLLNENISEGCKSVPKPVVKKEKTPKLKFPGKGKSLLD